MRPNLVSRRTDAAVITTAVLGSAMAFVDSTIVHVALPSLAESLGANFSELQWVVDAYLVMLGALILVGGALGDVYGRKRIFAIGLVAFAVSSAACGVAQDTHTLIAARAVQGIGAALLMPGSLALISTHFEGAARAGAIARWSALSALATAAGPLLGGFIVEHYSWRWAFWLNLPLAAAALVTLRKVPSDTLIRSRRVDAFGGLLAALLLGSLSLAMIEAAKSVNSNLVGAASATAFAAAVIFFWQQRRTKDPMLPAHLLRNTPFMAANAISFLIYFAFMGCLFYVTLFVQLVAGLGPLQTGLSLFPVTVALTALSGFATRASARFGPRYWLAIASLVLAAALYSLSTLPTDATLIHDILPRTTLLGLGMAALVAPLTALVFESVDEAHGGVASGINNAVARLAGLFAVAALPVLAASRAAGSSEQVLTATYAPAVRIAAGIMVLCGGLTILLVRTRDGHD